MEKLNIELQKTAEEGAASETPSFEMDSTALQWWLFMILGTSVLIFSGSLNLYILKQNRVLTLQRSQLTAQNQRFQQAEMIAASLIEDVGNFASQHPDLQEIISKHGIQKREASPSSTSSISISSPPIPAPPESKSVSKKK